MDSPDSNATKTTEERQTIRRQPMHSDILGLHLTGLPVFVADAGVLVAVRTEDRDAFLILDVSTETVLYLGSIERHGHFRCGLGFDVENDEAVLSHGYDLIETVAEIRQFLKPVSTINSSCLGHAGVIGLTRIDDRVPADDLIRTIVDDKMDKIGRL